MTRRAFAGAIACSPFLTAAEQIAFYDYHVHLSALVTLDKALALEKERGITFGIVEHAGKKEYPYAGMLNNDEDVRRFITRLDGKPVMKGIQAEGMDWMEAFSKEAIAKLDYVLSDALTMPQKDGKLVRIWTPALVIPPGGTQEWMDLYTAFNVRVIAEEPIDIIANPTFLPDAIVKEYDTLWTPARMKRIVDAAVKYNVAIEINSRYRVPSLAFLKMAKAAGAKFSFGSNIHTLDVGNIDYCREMAKVLALTPKDVFKPAPAGKKPIQIRRFSRQR